MKGCVRKLVIITGVVGAVIAMVYGALLMRGERMWTPIPQPVTVPTLMPSPTPMPSPTSVPTDTPPPPTATQTHAPVMTDESPTATSLPPTSTFTPVSTETWTPVPPTATPHPPTATHTSTVTPTPVPAARINQAMNIRSGPGTNYAVVDAAVAGNEYQVVGKNRTGDWWQIVLGEGRSRTFGWVYAPLTTSINTGGVKIAHNIPTPPPTSTPVPPTNTPVPPTNTPVPPTSVPPTPVPAHTSEPERGAQYYKNRCGVGKRGWVTISLAKQCGFSMPVCQSTNPGLYEAMHDKNGDGCVGE